MADLVLLNGNPLADINNVLNVRAVVANGRYFDRATLDSLDPEGTRPNTGLVALEHLRQRNYSANFVERTDTTDVPLTEDLFTRYVSTWTALHDYWEAHKALLDSAAAYTDYPVIPEKSLAAIGGDKQIRLLDYVTLTQQNSALSEIFKKNGLPPENFGPIQITLVKNALRVGPEQPGGSTSEKAKIAASNTAFVEAHKAELAKVEVTF